MIFKEKFLQTEARRAARLAKIQLATVVYYHALCRFNRVSLVVPCTFRARNRIKVRYSFRRLVMYNRRRCSVRKLQNVPDVHAYGADYCRC